MLIEDGCSLKLRLKNKKNINRALFEVAFMAMAVVIQSFQIRIEYLFSLFSHINLLNKNQSQQFKLIILDYYHLLSVSVLFCYLARRGFQRDKSLYTHSSS